MLGVVRTGAGDDRDGHGRGHGTPQAQLLLVGEDRALAGGPAEHQAVAPVFGQPAGELDRRVDVEGARLVERGHHGGDQPPEAGRARRSAHRHFTLPVTLGARGQEVAPQQPLRHLAVDRRAVGEGVLVLGRVGEVLERDGAHFGELLRAASRRRRRAGRACGGWARSWRTAGSGSRHARAPGSSSWTTSAFGTSRRSQTSCMIRRSFMRMAASKANSWRSRSSAALSSL